MAASATVPRTEAIRLEYGMPEALTIKFVTGKNIGNSKNPPFLMRVMFSFLEGPLFLDAEDGSALEMRLRDLRVGAGDQVVLTKIRLARGAGSVIRCERAQSDAAEPVAAPPAPRQAPPSPIAALLEKSVDIARSQGAGAFITPPLPAEPFSERQIVTPRSAAMCAAMCAAVDSVMDTQAYAARKGLGLTFSEESVRAIGLTIFIQQSKEGR